MDVLFEQIDGLIKRRTLPWSRRGATIIVKLAGGHRRHQVRLARRDDQYVFRSTVLRANEFPNGTRIEDLAYRAWRRNTISELVAFTFDESDALIGVIEQPVATLDDKDLQVYVETLTTECDRLEYALRGGDVP
jgi:hypothetical protein